MCERCGTGEPSVDEVGEVPDCFCLLLRGKMRANKNTYI